MRPSCEFPIWMMYKANIAAEQGKIAIHDDEDLDDGANGEEQAEMGFDLA